MVIKELLPYAKERDLVIVLEEHPGFAGTIVKMEKILELIPDKTFGIAFDMKNTLREGENPLVILDKKEVLDRVLYTHVDNFLYKEDGSWERSVTIDKGYVDIRKLINGLKKNGYDGWLSIEYGGNNIEHVFNSIEWLKKNWVGENTNEKN
jgi:sugar phosphate isomerase/epimerase